MENEVNTDTGEKRQFNVHNIYLKDASFEIPHAPHVFSEEWKPRLDFELEIIPQNLTDGVIEVVLFVSVSVKLHHGTDEEKVAFLTDIKQAGIFGIANFTEEEKQQLIYTTCPNILFPYVREAVSNVVVKGGFPQLPLPPMNFEAMYLQKLKEQQEKQAAG